MSLAKKIEDQQKKALSELIKWFGGQSVAARYLGVSKQVVSNWVARGRISATSAIDAQRVTAGEIKKEYLRPDVMEWKK